jgi:hypothetical protein
MKSILMMFFLFILLTIAIYCLFFPRSVQTLASRTIELWPASKVRALHTFVNSDLYIVNVRAVGIGALIMFAFIVFGLYKSGPP